MSAAGVSEAELDRASAFIERFIDDPTERGLAAALDADAAASEALLAVVHDRFVAGGPGFGELEEDPMFWRLAILAATTWTPEQRQRFADATLFRAAGPDAYRWLAPLARAVFRADQAERIILAAIERGDAATRVNASHLAYHLFTGDAGYALSEIGARRLRDADPLGGGAAGAANGKAGETASDA